MNGQRIWGGAVILIGGPRTGERIAITGGEPHPLHVGEPFTYLGEGPYCIREAPRERTFSAYYEGSTQLTEPTFYR